MGTTIQCPVCRAGVQVAMASPGQAIACQSCGRSFQAVRKKPVGPPPVPGNDEEFASPLEESDRRESRPARQPQRKSRASGGLYDQLMKKQRKMSSPHRGVLVLVLGILSVLFAWTCFGGVALAVFAFNMATNDLNEMYSGRMDASGRTLTAAGRVLGIVGGGLSVCLVLASCCLMSIGRAVSP
jgi:hypothetical protein